MITVNQLSVSFSGNPLFEDLSFVIRDKDRIGLTGKNGAGKSTLLKILAQQQAPDSGTIILTSGHEVGYLPQEMTPSSERSILEETLTAFEKLDRLEEQIRQYTQELADRTDFESKDYLRLIDKLTIANERLQMLGANDKHGNTEKVLLGLGFKHSDFNRKLTEFSTGWQMRVELAKILLKMPEVMLLDEPTNHLDIESIQWLEEFLQTYSGAVVLVSHDRMFLDHVTQRTIEIVLGHIEDYNVSYSGYIQQREERRNIQQAAYDNQQKEIENIERFIERFRYKATKARQAQSRIKLLDKMEKIEIDEFDTSSIAFRFPPAPHSGKIVVRTEQLQKYYGDKEIFSQADFVLERGEKVALVGRNGEGKSTFSKIIIGEITDYKGEFQLGHQVQIGYFAQNQAALLDGSKTVFETIDDIAVGDVRSRIRNILGCFLFSGEDTEKKVKVLSGGEKTRLALAKLLLEPVNLLVLDEPTNHLDMRSKDILKTALLQYDGSLIIVSHDRDFLSGLTDKVYEFRDHRIRTHLGDISTFLEDRKIEQLQELNLTSSKTPASPTEKNRSAASLSREEQKLADREERKRKNRIEKIEAEITVLEEKIEALHQLFMEDSNSCTVENSQKYEYLKAQLEEKMAEWEELV